MNNAALNPKIHIACSREGVFFLLFMAGLGAAALYTSKNSLIMLFCILLCMLAATIIIGRANVQKLSISRRQEADIFAGSEAHISLITQNLSKKQRYALHIFEDFGQNRTIGPVFVPILNPAKTANATYDCVFHKRGPVHFRQVQVRSRFPLPFFEFRASYPLPGTHTVFPHRLPTRSSIRFDEAPGTAPAPHGKKYPVIHEMQDGRQQGRILWKLSAKRGEMIEEIQKTSHSGQPHAAIRITPKNLLSAEQYETQISEITDYCLTTEHAVDVSLGNTTISSAAHKKLLEFLANA